jgi:UV DNA damage repair endonuclease
VLDTHHHTFNDGELSMADAHAAACETWGTIRPLQHISNTEPELANGSTTDRRKHSNMIHYVPEPQLQALRDDTIDVDVEAKFKNVAVSAMVKQFCIPM